VQYKPKYTPPPRVAILISIDGPVGTFVGAGPTGVLLYIPAGGLCTLLEVTRNLRHVVYFATIFSYDKKK